MDISAETILDTSRVVAPLEDPPDYDGPDLPYEVAGHCLEDIGNEEYFICGGRGQSSVYGSTLLITHSPSFSYTYKAEMLTSRYLMGCGKIKLASGMVSNIFVSQKKLALIMVTIHVKLSSILLLLNTMSSSFY